MNETLCTTSDPKEVGSDVRPDSSAGASSMGEASPKESGRNQFLKRHAENGDLNQYWYSQHTIETLIKEIESVAINVAFLSTPSVYFSLAKASQLQANSRLFDFDKQFSRDPRFVFYDFQSPGDVPKELHNTFDCVVIDPPFITQEVWENYVATARLLSIEGGKAILSTIPENREMLWKLFSARPCAFLPAIPNLVYQYNFFTNYETKFLCCTNPEIPISDD
ncbi:hypothetical protein BSKO_14022 [Bryopsis sp. KO-2023]|nr:hypothetical protein BSKO_14022 [Bryopsis sp. KO-2023]